MVRGLQYHHQYEHNQHHHTTTPPRTIISTNTISTLAKAMLTMPSLTCPVAPPPLADWLVEPPLKGGISLGGIALGSIARQHSPARSPSRQYRALGRRECSRGRHAARVHRLRQWHLPCMSRGGSRGVAQYACMTEEIIGS